MSGIPNNVEMLLAVARQDLHTLRENQAALIQRNQAMVQAIIGMQGALVELRQSVASLTQGAFEAAFVSRCLLEFTGSKLTEHHGEDREKWTAGFKDSKELVVGLLQCAMWFCDSSREAARVDAWLLDGISSGAWLEAYTRAAYDIWFAREAGKVAQ